MPCVDPGREKVKQYLEENNISIHDLSVVYGIKPQDMASYLSGKLKTTRANQIILRIISDYKIR
jgi:hypothetical protein